MLEEGPALTAMKKSTLGLSGGLPASSVLSPVLCGPRLVAHSTPAASAPSTAKRTGFKAYAVDTDTPTDTPCSTSDNNPGTATGPHDTSIGLSEGSSVRKSGPQACVQFLRTEHGYVSSIRAG